MALLGPLLPLVWLAVRRTAQETKVNFPPTLFLILGSGKAGVSEGPMRGVKVVLGYLSSPGLRLAG